MQKLLCNHSEVMEVKVLDINGKETGRKVKLSDSVFGIEPNNHAVYLDVKQYLANQRQGTHKAKERAEVAGSTRKIKKQKEQELLVQVVLRIHYLKVEEQFLVQDQEVILLN
jgi:large subunit ribosomal protein L4